MNEPQTSRLITAEVQEPEPGRYEISWESAPPGVRVEIHVGDRPELIPDGEPAAVVEGSDRAVLTGFPAQARRYFRLTPQGGRPLITARRQVALEAAYNFRDLGGYPGLGGRRVVWGRVFRSDGLGRLTEGDQAVLTEIGLKTVIDFRTTAEVESNPDQLPEPDGPEYLNLPIARGEFNFLTAMNQLKAGDATWMTPGFMAEGYVDNIDNHPEVWRELFHRLVDDASMPLVFHCTGGKDRAGTAAALILLALGVSEEDVVYDHQLSNFFIAGLVQSIFEKIKSYGVDPEQVAPYFTAPLEAIEALLNRLKTEYGGIENYLLQKVGLSPELPARLRSDLLE